MDSEYCTNNNPLEITNSMDAETKIINNVNKTVNTNDNNAEIMNLSEKCVNFFSFDNPSIITDSNISEINEITVDKQSAGETTDSTVISAISTSISKKCEINDPQVNMTDALRGIATAYDCSTDDDDDEEEVVSDVKESFTLNPAQQATYRCKKIEDEIDSEDDSRSTISMSSSSSSSSQKCIDQAVSDSDDENEDHSRPKKGKNHEKGEYDDLPPIEDLTISVPEVLCDPVGEVGWIVEQMVVVTPKPLKPTLNIDTVLFIEKGRRVLGRIFDVFGPVSDPHYCVRFNNSEHIKKNNIEIAMTVYYCPNTPYTTLVFMKDLLKIKASDDVGDEEHPAFSDDEEERAYYSSLKQKQVNNKSNGNEKNPEIPKKRVCKNENKTGWKSRHPWNSERRMQSQKHLYNPNYNNTQQSNMWQYSSLEYNNWLPNPAFYNRPQPISNNDSRFPYISSSLQSNRHFPRQVRPNFMWPNNGPPFPPTHIPNASWRTPTPPLPRNFSSYSPPPPPPGI